MRPQSPSRRQGFTLVELMMVALVISILMSMLVAGVYVARRQVRNAQVIHEIGMIDMAMESYVAKRAAGYPPCTAGNDTSSGVKGGNVAAHLRGAYSNYYWRWFEIEQYVGQAFNGFSGNVNNTPTRALSLATLDPAELMVFWLAGPPNAKSGTGFAGFSMDRENPLASDIAGVDGYVAQRMPPYFEFDPRRLRDYDGDGWPEFIPPLGGDQPPYVYFDNQAVNGGGVHYPNVDRNLADAGPNRISQWGFAVPYRLASSRAEAQTYPDRPANGHRFQIISAGGDGRYGKSPEDNDDAEALLVRYTPLMEYYDGNAWQTLASDQDNLSNVSVTTLGESTK